MTTRIRVVYVDDESDSRTLRAQRLEQASDQITVTTAATVDDALELLCEEPVDCVLSDYRMPGTDGLEFLSQVRDRWPDIPFILYTGQGSEDVAAKTISAGAADYVQKERSTEHFELLAQRIIAATEQRRASESERIAALVREIQSDLVRARTRTEVETSVCERLVDADPYVFAWVGAVDATNDRVEPRASAGWNAGYLDSVDITVDGHETGQGPTGTAVRTRSTQVVQRISDAAAYDPWREDALDRGYRSSAAIPVEYDGHLYGIVNVYADRPNAFDAEERSLLEELAETVAHALYRVRVQEQYDSQYQELFENAPVMMAFTRERDGEPVIEDCNQQFADKLGYAPADLRDRPLAELYTGESVTKLLEQDGYERALDGEFTTQEREFVTADGDRLETLLQATPRRDDEGEIVGTHALYVDITERKRAQSVLEQAEAMEASMDGMAIHDEDGEFVYVNQAFADIFGYDTPEQLVGESWRHLNADDTEEWFEREVDPVLEETGEWRGKTTGLRADGTTFPQELSLTRLAEDTEIAVVRDITERVERERKLEQLSREFETVFENVQDALFLLDVDDEQTVRFQRFNQHESEFVGKSTDDVRGKTPVEVFGEDLGTRLEANYRECVERQETVVYEEVLPIGSETSIWQTKLTPIVVDGHVEQIVGSGRDVTTLKSRERTLERLVQRTDDIIDASSREEIGEVAVDIAETALDSPLAGVHLASNDRQRLESVAAVDEVREEFDAPPAYSRADDDTASEIVWDAFDRGEPVSLDDTRAHGTLAEETPARSALVHPLGGHGVFIVSATEPDAFDQTDRNFVELLSKTVTASLDRYAHEQELERTQERLRVLFDEAPDAIAIHDADGNVLDVNEQNVDNLGYSREELLSMNVTDYEVGLSAEEAQEHWAEMDIGETLKVEGEHERADGSTYPVEVWVSKIDVQGDQRFLALGRDITDRKEREQKLKQFERAIEQTGHAVYITDEDGTVEYVNPTFEEITGYSETEALGQTPETLGAGDQDDEPFWEAIPVGERWEGELVTERAGGDEIILDQTVSPISSEDDDTEKFVAVAQDITRRKEYEQALERTRTELRQIIDLVPDLIFVKDRDGEYLLANEATAEAYGRTVEEIEGSPETAVIPDTSDSAEFRRDDIEVIESGEPMEIPAEELTTADGETRILQTRKLPYDVPGSGETAVLGYARDVTELKTYERRLERQRDNLEILNQVVRHDIRNDLQVALTYAERVRPYVDDGEEYVEKILESTRDAVDITTTARDVTEVMLQSDVDRRPIPLRLVLENEVDDVRTNHEDALVKIDGSVPATEVYADDMLASVFRNVLTNAVTHNDKAVPEVTVSVTRDDDSVLVRIADNGPGIPDDRKEKIFEQGEMGLDSDGTGLGLYLVDTLVDRYGGRIHVADNDPDGTVFTIQLPVATVSTR